MKMFIAVLIIVLFSYTITGSADAYMPQSDVFCNSCDDCEAKINNASSGDTVTLTADINSLNDGVMLHNTRGIIFDGAGHTITGPAEKTGINIDATCGNITLKNLSVTNFRHGIYIFCSDGNTVENVTSSHNIGDGVSVLYSSENVIKDCTLEENGYYDFDFVAHLKEDCYNEVVNVTGSMGNPIGFYNSTTADLHDCVFSELILANTDSSILQNVTVAGSINHRNNGIKLYYSDYMNFTEVYSSYNCWGISATRSNHNKFDDVTCNHNSQTGIHLSNSNYSVLNDTTTNHNGQCGVYVSHSPNTVISNACTSYNSFAGVYLDTGGNNVVNGTSLVRNRDPGILTARSSGNLIYNNIFYDNDYPDNRWQVSVSDANANAWNVTKQFGKNIIGGGIICGNYWYGVDMVDVNGDGIGDEPYMINGVSNANVDYLPITCLQCTGICGDVDCNGRVTATDIVETYYRAVDPEYLLVSEWAADVDNNTYVSANDVVEIYRKAVDPEHELNCAC